MQEKEEFFQELQQKTGKQVFNVAKILMKELADEDLQEKMAQSFVKKIDNLSKKDRQKIREQAEETDYSMHVSSRFDLSDDSKSRIEKSLRDKISSKIKLNFDSTDEFVCGINLQIDGHKVVWTVDEYLQNLEDEFEEELKNRFESTKKANENE
jgi:F-type H+-transporting ATPase subunit b